MILQVQIEGIKKKKIEKRPILSKAASSSLKLFCDEISGHHNKINSQR